MAICAQDFMDWIAPGHFFTGRLSEQFESISIEADAIHETILCDELALCHFEFQSGPDSHMAQRILEYLILAYRCYGCPVTSYVIYLKPCKNIPAPPLKLVQPDGKVILTLEYEVIVLPEIPYEKLLAKGLKGLLPLVPLAGGGAKREVIEEIIMRLVPAHDTISREVLVFASLAFDKDDTENQEWITRRFAMYQDILRDTPAYQHILQMGLQEGRQKGLQEGLAKGREEERQARLQDQGKMLLAIVQARFPTLNKQAQKQVNHIKDLTALERLVISVGSAITLEDAQRALLAGQAKKQHG